VGRITTSGDITEYPTPGSGFPTEIRLGPDGNMWAEDVFHTLAYLRVQAAAQHTSYVMNESLVFLPHSQTVRLGNTVRWTLGSPMTQEISDASGLDLYDSGPLGFVSTFDHPFSSSGSYPFEDRLHPLAAGSIDVPVLLRTGAGAEDARVTWATEPPPPGLVFDVQVEQPGAAHFVHWKTTASVEHAWFRPGDPKYTSDGEYSFRARLLDPQSGHATAFSSPATTIPLG
jgi:plastocyanin